MPLARLAANIKRAGVSNKERICHLIISKIKYCLLITCLIFGHFETIIFCIHFLKQDDLLLVLIMIMVIFLIII